MQVNGNQPHIPRGVRHQQRRFPGLFAILVLHDAPHGGGANVEELAGGVVNSREDEVGGDEDAVFVGEPAWCILACAWGEGRSGRGRAARRESRGTQPTLRLLCGILRSPR